MTLMVLEMMDLSAAGLMAENIYNFQRFLARTKIDPNIF